MQTYFQNISFRALPRTKGFSLIEVALSIGIVTILLALSVPQSLRFYQKQSLGDARATLASSLRSQQMSAYQGKHDSDFGIKFFADHYVLFEGRTFSLRNVSQDASQEVGSNIAIAGRDELVFMRSSGTPNATGTYTLTINTDTEHVTVNEIGLVE